MSMHDCPIDDCGQQVPQHLLMCRRHWNQVPRDLKTAVYRAYRQRSEAGGLRRHLQAIEDASAAVEGREPEELFA